MAPLELVHNTHMLIPKPLWRRLRERAAIEGRTVTEIMVEASREYLEKKPRAKNPRR